MTATREVIIDYTNWQGTRRERRILPLGTRFGTSEWHPGEQWLLIATDTERDVKREFAMSCIHGWRAAI